MRDRRFRAIVLDLFDTLVSWNPHRLPEMEIDGRRSRTTIPLLAPALERALGRRFELDAFLRAYGEVIAEIEAARRASAVEITCRERFDRTLARLGVADEGGVLAEELTRLHMAAVRSVTSAPAEHPAAVRRLAPHYRLGVLSNFDDARTGHEVIRDTGVVDRFEVVIISAEVALRKPHPAIFRLLLDRLCLEPREVLFVGDNPREDVAGARAAGIPVAWVMGRQTEFPEGLAEPDYRVSTIAELPDLLGV